MGSPCPTNVTVFTDPVITADGVPDVREVHLTELRTAVNNERNRRGLGNYTFTDSPLVADQDKGRQVHTAELRTAIDQAAAAAGCTTDTVVPPVWTDDPLVADIDLIRKVHMDQMRSVTNDMEDECVCDCDFCACDCNCVCHCCTCDCDHSHQW